MSMKHLLVEVIMKPSLFNHVAMLRATCKSGFSMLQHDIHVFALPIEQAII